MLAYALVGNLSEAALLYYEGNFKLKLIFGNSSVNKAQILWDRSVEDYTTDSSFYKA